MEGRPTSHSVTAYASGLKWALIVQAFAVVLAFAAVVVSGVLVNNNRNELRRIELARDRAVGAFDSIATAATLLLNEDYDLADETLRTALKTIPLDEDSPNTEATRTWRRVSETLRRKQIEILVRQKRTDEAINAYEELQNVVGEERKAELLRDIATLYCATEQTALAKELLSPSFQSEHPALLTDPAFLDACGDLFGGSNVDPVTVAQPSAVPAEFAIKRLFLHIRTESQRAAAIDLANALCATGYMVPGIQLIPEPRAYPSNGQVRYYYAEQKAQAAALIEAIGRAASAPDREEPGWADPFKIVLFSRDGLPKDRAEVWVPPLGRERSTSADTRFDCRAVSSTAIDAPRIVAALNDPEASVRVSAGQQIAELIRSADNDSVIGELINQITEPNLSKLSASGRFNVLYMLNLEPTWRGQRRADELSRALNEIGRRAGQGVVIGLQTQDCIDKLRAKLEGENASDRCGGR